MRTNGSGPAWKSIRAARAALHSHVGGTLMRHRMFCTLLLIAAAAVALPASAGGGKKDDWINLFNGKDTAGWKLRSDKITGTKFLDAAGKEIAGAKAGKVDQKEEIQDKAGKPIAGARVVDKGGKKLIVDADGKDIAGAKLVKVGGRAAIVSAKGEEIKDAKAVPYVMDNPSGWIVENGELVCARPHIGAGLLTTQTFTDFELDVEFQATRNSGVYLQGRYEIQIDNSFGAKPKVVVEKDGKKMEMLSGGQCGALYGQ